MSDYKHISAIHKDTKELISSFQLTHDITWIGHERDDFICLPIDIPMDVNEIKLIFVKEYPKIINNNKINVLPHFRRKAGEPKTISERGGESKEHRLAKKEVYEKIWKGELKINGTSLDKSKVKNITIEYRTSSKGYVIADIIILFMNRHHDFNNGINIEIQFSKQTDELTRERTYQRLIRGFSVVWLTRTDFSTNGNLKNNNIQVEPYEVIMDRYKEFKYNSFLKKLNNIGKAIDSKVAHIKNEQTKINSSMIYFKSHLSNVHKEIGDKINNEVTCLVDEKMDNIRRLYNNVNQDISSTINPKIIKVQEMSNRLDMIKESINISSAKEDFDKFFKSYVNDQTIIYKKKMETNMYEIIDCHLKKIKSEILEKMDEEIRSKFIRMDSKFNVSICEYFNEKQLPWVYGEIKKEISKLREIEKDGRYKGKT